MTITAVGNTARDFGAVVKAIQPKRKSLRPSAVGAPGATNMLRIAFVGEDSVQGEQSSQNVTAGRVNLRIILAGCDNIVFTIFETRLILTRIRCYPLPRLNAGHAYFSNRQGAVMDTHGNQAVGSPPPPSVSLKGYLIRERNGQLWIQDQIGTWIVNANDIVGRGEWSGVADTRFSGKPEIFYIQGDAEIYEVVPLKMKPLSHWPLAILTTARVSNVKGLDGLETLALERSMEEMLEEDSTYTYCKGPDGRKYICDNR